jgi:hypothetical protein
MGTNEEIPCKMWQEIRITESSTLSIVQALTAWRSRNKGRRKVPSINIHSRANYYFSRLLTLYFGLSHISEHGNNARHRSVIFSE